MAQAAIPQTEAPAKDYGSLESPVMDAYMSVECAREMIGEEMDSLFSQLKGDGTEKVYFSRMQAERCVWMINQAADRLNELKTAYYGKGN